MKSNALEILILIALLNFCSLIMQGQMMSHSHHDFNISQWNGTASCTPCHPGSGETERIVPSPVWINNTVSPFDLYSDSPLDRDPGSTSKLCLSCHDGIMGDDNYTEYHNSYIITDTTHVFSNMMNNHPVSVIYDYQPNSNSRLKLRDPNTTMTGLGGTIAQDLLVNGKVECTSCHDIHVTRNIGSCKGCHTMSTNKPSSSSLTLWITNDYSALCRTCHDK